MTNPFTIQQNWITISGKTSFELIRNINFSNGKIIFNKAGSIHFQFICSILTEQNTTLHGLQCSGQFLKNGSVKFISDLKNSKLIEGEVPLVLIRPINITQEKHMPSSSRRRGQPQRCKTTTKRSYPIHGIGQTSFSSSSSCSSSSSSSSSTLLFFLFLLFLSPPPSPHCRCSPITSFCYTDTSIVIPYILIESELIRFGLRSY